MLSQGICGDLEEDEERDRRRRATPTDVEEADALWDENRLESKSAYLSWALTHSGFPNATGE